jgi:type VI secretion system secreted protein VgrG
MQLDVKGQELADLEILSFTGAEKISAPYQYTVRFLTSTETITHTLAGKQVSFQYGVEGLLARMEPAYVHGFISTHNVLGLSLSRKYITQIVILPRLSLLSYSGQRQVSGTTSPIKMHELAQAMLNPATFKQNTSTAAQFADEQPIDCDVPGDIVSTQRNFVLQYYESDLDFFRRILEQDGIFFFISNDEAKDVVNFGDKNQVFKEIKEKISYVPDNVPNAPQTEYIRSLTMQTTFTEKEAYVRDYNYDNASQSAQFLRSHAVDPDGSGTTVTYDDHFATTTDGDRYAQIHAEKLLTWQTQYFCSTNSTRLRPGMLFNLDTDERKLSSLIQRFLVVKSNTNFSQASEDVPGSSAAPFTNSLICLALPADAATFRPYPSQQKPRVQGVLNAVIDNDSSGSVAKVESNGTYRIRLIEEESTTTRLPAGKASADVRQMQPFGGGGGTGLQFPLYKGTEVLLAFVEGDPDRPVIVGTVANSENKSVLEGIDSSLSINKTNVIRTSSGISIELIDG